MSQNAALFAAFSDLKNLPTVEQLKTLLEDADVNAPNEKGYTVLYYAIQTGNLALAKALLEQGAKLQLEEAPTLNSKLCSPFHAIIFVLIGFKDKKPGFEDPQLAVDFLELCVSYAGESILNAQNKYSETILHFLAQDPHPLLLEKVLSYENLNFTLPSPNNSHRTPLYFALQIDNDAVSKVMIDRGATINHYTEIEYNTPIFKMIRRENYELFDYTVKQRVDRYGVIQARLNNIGEASVTAFVENKPEMLEKFRKLGCLEYRPYVEVDETQTLAATVKNSQNVHSTGSVRSLYDSLTKLQARYPDEKAKKAALGAIFGVSAREHYTGRAQLGITLETMIENLQQSLPQVRTFYAQNNEGQIADDEEMIFFVAEAAKKALDRIKAIEYVEAEETPEGDILLKDHKEALALVWQALKDDENLYVMQNKDEAEKFQERILLYNALWFNLAQVSYEYQDAQACASGLYGAILASLSFMHVDIEVSPEEMQAKYDVTSSVITQNSVAAVLADLLQSIYTDVHQEGAQLYVAFKVLDDFSDPDFGFETLFNETPTQEWSPELQQFLGKVKTKWIQDFKKYYPQVNALDKDAFLALEEALRNCDLSAMLKNTLYEQLRLFLETASEGAQNRVLGLIAGEQKTTDHFAETKIPVQHWRAALEACSSEYIQNSHWYQRLQDQALLKKVLVYVRPELLGVAAPVVALDFSGLQPMVRDFNEGKTFGVYRRVRDFLDHASEKIQDHILRGVANSVQKIADVSLVNWEFALKNYGNDTLQAAPWYQRLQKADPNLLQRLLQKTGHVFVQTESSDTSSVKTSHSSSQSVVSTGCGL